jgi:Dehydrogenases with different specificities (related to short-chain alcohol dehydrogenases)
MLLGDLFLLSDVKNMADKFKKKYNRLDVLINNAGGIMNKEREITKEGLEKTIVLNLLTPFLLTQSLIDVLAKSPSARIINLSSEMHKRGGKPDFNDFQLLNSYSCSRAYGLSKLYLIWISRHFITELKQKGLVHITVNVVHPATTNTNFGLDSNKGFLNNLIFRVVMPFTLTPEQGAESSIYLATSDEVKNVTGKYYAPKKKLAKADDRYYSAENEKIVWEYCKQITKPYLSN